MSSAVLRLTNSILDRRNNGYGSSWTCSKVLVNCMQSQNNFKVINRDTSSKIQRINMRNTSKNKMVNSIISGTNKNYGKSIEQQIVKNPCNIQMISDELHRHLFPDVPRQTQNGDTRVVDICKKHLESHNLWEQTVSQAPPVNIKLPDLVGKNIDEHFREIALEESQNYKTFLEHLVLNGIPRRPSTWILQEGWTKYTSNEPPVSVPYPEGNAFIFDIEVCMNAGQVPTMATAVSTNAWYGWCSSLLVSSDDRNPKTPATMEELIPFETTKDENGLTSKEWRETIIVGHNVSYDRARIKEPYFLQVGAHTAYTSAVETKTRFLDTMSMHIAISGITSYQRALKLTVKSNLKKQNTVTEEDVAATGDFDWNDTSSLNNLNDVYMLYCPGKEELKKEERNIFVNGTISEIREDFQKLMSYCSRDVEATYEILVKILPQFFERFPHPVTFAGTLEMGQSYLPINENWNKYINKSVETFEKLEKDVKQVLMQKADDALKLLPEQKYKEDPWLWNLDWKVSKVRTKKTLKSATKSKVKKAEATTPLEESCPEMPPPDPPKAYPAWYKKLFYKTTDEDYEPGPAKISTSMQVVPKLLRLCWFGLPLHHTRQGGWGFLVKKVEQRSTSKESFDKEVSDLSPEGSDTLNSVVGEEANEFPYKQWEDIWEHNKVRLIKEYPMFKKSTTKQELIGKQVKDKSEDAAQDLNDFMKGLEALTTLGLRSANSKPSKKTLDVPSPHVKCEFRPLPHKDGANYKVGNPLAKDFLNKIEENILTCSSGVDVANKVVRVSKMVSYWRNNRDRIMGQIAVWINNGSSSNINCEEKLGAILPQVVVSGTLTRRAVEPTWMTASNAYTDRVGSELKGMVQAPRDYHFVGADVDSQELWIASVIGDSHFAAIHGCTALGWMTLQGNKSSGTDMHSKTASLIGIERDQAKVLNYARIYGAGVNFAERLLMQFNHRMRSEDARVKARAMYKMTKGEKKYLLNEEGQLLAEKNPKFASKSTEPFTKQEIQSLLRQADYTYNFMDVCEKTVWDSGTESHMFNQLEEIAQQECPQTPILHCSISRSLVPSAVQNDFMTSRVNWVVQSSAVDYLHLMLVCMRWLFKKYDIKGRFSLSVHDEVRFLVKSKDRYKAALALQITNVFTRAMCSYQLGMYDIPQSVAFFSCVDIDKVLRKEVTQDCKTPSNPEGLWKTYNIPEGEALDIYALLEKTGNDLAANQSQSIQHADNKRAFEVSVK